MIRVYVDGVALLGPGLQGWASSRAVLAGSEPYVWAPTVVPPSPLLPANERRRTVQTVKLALAVGAEAMENARCEAAAVATVFTSSGGDGETIDDILATLASPDPEVSPTRFHNSVHNAPAGYWSIATRSREPSSSLCFHDWSFTGGLLDAASQAGVDDRSVALIAYDLPYPEPLHGLRPIGAVFATALVLAPRASATSLAWLDIELCRGAGEATVMVDAGLEAVRRSVPAARSLPLLTALARPAPTTVILDHVAGNQLSLSLAPLEPRADPAIGHDAPALATS
jgi:Beta-ketoacyl synthase, N-terminal domain